MSQSRKSTTPATTSNKGNITKSKLKGTPFNSSEELKAAQAEILEDTWRKLERARLTRELTQKDEYRFFIETFKKGMVCKYGEKGDNLVRVSLDDDDTIQISISESMQSKESSEHLLGVLVESMASSLLSNYLKAMGIVDSKNEIEEQIRSAKKNQTKK